MEISFCKLKSKSVINVCNGKNLGCINDIIIDMCSGKILAIVVPSQSKNLFSFFRSNKDIIIPYNRICKIGEDTILVDIIIQISGINNENITSQSITTNDNDVKND